MRWLLSGLMALSIGSGFAQQTAVSTSLAHSLNDAFTTVYEKVSPSVVVIEVERALGPALQGLPSGFNFYMRPSHEMDQGSGIIISPQGYILTNQHVVGEDDNGRITVILKDGRKFSAKMIGVDNQSDIAVLKIDADKLPVAELADSDLVKVGQFAFAIGAPFNLPYTFTVGVISAKARTELMQDANYEEYLQTDASISPGNSGGPLCDIDGRVVGVNTLISGINRGLGFAVPIKIAKNVADQLIAHGRVIRPWLGISIIGLADSPTAQQQYPDAKSGVLVSSIMPNAPALSSDLQAGDIIVKVDGTTVTRSRELQHEILGKKIGQMVKLDVLREGQPMEISLRTGECPPEMLQAANRQMPSTPSLPLVRRHQPPPDHPAAKDDGSHGLTLRDADGDTTASGAVIDDVAPESAADTSGLKPGDIITEAGGKPVRSAKDFQAILEQSDLSRGVMIMIDRNGQKTFAILKP